MFIPAWPRPREAPAAAAAAHLVGGELGVGAVSSQPVDAMWGAGGEREDVRRRRAVTARSAAPEDEYRRPSRPLELIISRKQRERRIE